MNYKNENLSALAQILETIEEPRDNRGKRHRILDIFILTIFGLLCGHTDFTNMVLELKYHEKYFTELLGLENGIPSHDTFSAVFSIINPAEFLECFISGCQTKTKTINNPIHEIAHGAFPYVLHAYVASISLSRRSCSSLNLKTISMELLL